MTTTAVNAKAIKEKKKTIEEEPTQNSNELEEKVEKFNTLINNIFLLNLQYLQILMSHLN